VRAQIVAQALQRADRVEWHHLSAAAADGHRRIAFGPDYGDGFDLAVIEGQDVGVILQQYDAFASGLQGYLAALLIETGNGEVLLITIRPAELKLGAKNAANFIVDGVLGDLSSFDGR